MYRQFYQRLSQSIITVVAILLSTVACSDQERITLFPLDNYDQTITNWIKPSSPDFEKNLLDPAVQAKRLQIFKDHYYGERSPWNVQYVQKIVSEPAPNDIKNLEFSILKAFDNEAKPENQIGYGSNFRPYDANWFKAIEENIDFTQFNTLVYQIDHRAIATDNLAARVLPTNEPHFYSHKLAGQGYPFDNFQMSAVWAGTPLYILAETKDKQWALVITPDFIAWVETKGIARVDNQFVNQWTTAANANLAAIIKTKTPILHETHSLFNAYIGSIFPAEKTASGIKLMVPIANGHQASFTFVNVTDDDAVIMPLPLTVKNITRVMQPLIGRPYGWGGMYFNNDCSAELKSLFTPFAIWLPRHSSHQIAEGKLVDLSASTSEQRLAYLTEHGHPFSTIVYIGGHVFLYVGTHPNPKNGQPTALTYQDIWGLRPASNDMRAVIGKSVLFPLVQSYPEDKNLVPLTGKQIFQVAFLDELPPPSILNIRMELRRLMMTND